MENWPADKVHRRAVSELTPYARNARTHSDEQVAQIAASINEWGWTVPVLIDERGEIIAGHGRVLAAQRLGLPDVPCVVAEGWSEAQRRAYVLADNKLTLNGGWNDELLRVELADLQEMGFGLELTGFSLGEFEALGFDDDAPAGMPALPDGDREPFQQMTFTLHDEQVEEVKAAMEAAKALGPFKSPNENSNGNAIARVCETFLSKNGNS